MAATQDPDLVDAIIADHREFEALFGELERAGDSHRRELVDHVITELVRHSVAEEQHLYPVARQVLPGGDEEVDHEISEHTEAEKVMKRLEELQPGDARFEEALGTLIEDIRHHLRDEERDLLPQLREHCDAEELRDLGRKFENAKRVAPTRPHPAAPDRPPANKILDPGAGLIDRVRDALTGRHQ